MMSGILLIDDKNDELKALAEALRNELAGVQADVDTWVPQESDNPIEVFQERLKAKDVRLVVTDYDLTEQGQLGFFGATVVDWCQNRAIPVGDFSRGNTDILASEPNLFELRVPVESAESAAKYIAVVFRGFEEIHQAIARDENLLKQRSPGAALALLLGTKELESQFSQYGTRYGSANGALMSLFASDAADPERAPTAQDRAGMLAYIIGHLLVNAVLKFPGPILDREGLAAFLAVEVSEVDALADQFSSASYKGPFAGLSSYHWTGGIEKILSGFEEKVPADQEFESTGEHNRALLELALGRATKRPAGCERCKGKNGGFLCPFTRRTVCQRADCSVASNVWIPAGARLARIERDFYDEWAPILGM